MESEVGPHLFVMRIWVDASREVTVFSRGIIEHIPSGERRYFKDLGEMQAFVTSRLSGPGGTQERSHHAS